MKQKTARSKNPGRTGAQSTSFTPPKISKKTTTASKSRDKPVLRVQPSRAVKANSAKQLPSDTAKQDHPLSPEESLFQEDDAISTLEELEYPLIEDEGIICELHSYDCRYNTRGELVILRTGTNYGLDFDDQQSSEAALKLTRTYRWDKTLEKTRLEVQSPHIRLAMQEVIGSYPGANIDTKGSVILDDEPRCLFHYRDELREYADETTDVEAYRHVSFCLRYMYRVLRTEILGYEATMQSSKLTPSIEFAHLWMPFRPGDLVFTELHEAENVGIFKGMEKRFDNPVKPDELTSWTITWEQIHCDGEHFGRVATSGIIDKYLGHKPLVDLPVFPLEYHHEKERVKADLINRGRTYAGLAGVHHRNYNGRCLLYSTRRYPWDRNNDIPQSRELRSRIIIDAHEFHANEVSKSSAQFQILRTNLVKPQDDNNFTDQEYMTCYSHIPGFSLQTKQWAEFAVASILNPGFQNKAFDHLVLPLEKKEMIRSLVNQSENVLSSFDDLIEGKGKGLIFLLHGPPGVGKTFTAESIADYTQRPLYTVNCGELGERACFIEESLKRILFLATRWNAVVLLDEADVFLAERKTTDLERNGLVSVLLRMLEYFEGILFMTTNKVKIIDSAFKSRIHLSIAYPALDVSSRRELWATFVAKAANMTDPPPWLDRQLLDKISLVEVNGREIKNVARVAHALATNERRELESEDILKVLDALRTFDMESVEAPLEAKLDDVDELDD